MWWVSDHRRIGTVNPATGTVRSIHRPGEEIENSFSTGPDGAYVATKLSRANGILYAYTKPANAQGVDAWYLTGIDWRTGRTRFRIPTGTGDAVNNNWSPIALGPDGSAYVSAYGGILRVHDTNDRPRTPLPADTP
ncbi:hypothetical protein AB0O47_17900 [Streptomyces noursei]|uniref:hypothetical protein n=1 Tax=Streptomyces noursei TaxID=1971 RepID=UPI00344DE54B